MEPPVYIFWDTETTGISKSDEIVEISMVRVQDLASLYVQVVEDFGHKDFGSVP
jgi:DNA polymerase III epsilon subunit-like protein